MDPRFFPFTGSDQTRVDPEWTGSTWLDNVGYCRGGSGSVWGPCLCGVYDEGDGTVVGGGERTRSSGSSFHAGGPSETTVGTHQ